MSNRIPHETWMDRCLQLAALGEATAAPNPMVGAVLVHNDRVIGEGWHKAYGGPHAEVHCFDSVADSDRPLIEHSTLYVSLEPCAHWGKTPPCADRIREERVPRVVVGCRDPFPLVDGKGIERLRAAGVEVTVGIREEECRRMNAAFFTFHTRKRPFITLKWAQSADGFIAGFKGRRVAISNAASARGVHRLRAQHGAILVGTNTALFDDPELTTRHWPGSNPLRIVLDRQLRLPASLRLFNGEHSTLVLNAIQKKQHHNLEYIRLDFAKADIAAQVCELLYVRGITSLLVEGGAQLLQHFIDSGHWDRVCRITAPALHLRHGIAAPLFSGGSATERHDFAGDWWDEFRASSEDSVGLLPR
ncbi:MAG: bifunctional diaminohydroxyphosphoribosylaminopyrimidine deaminase/5-amino-6-(5-phosphoribosylamino)uracil reductase RibD [Chitinophagaceae bacterium]|nr:MAG: bifunctional diaminohydroxyphosphoribosylaminopyrimidine deaminase/5-amino-6-(5-phosphoribosylamino)uracil reductase RibD [Chitinophagaceae bacterium]